MCHLFVDRDLCDLTPWRRAGTKTNKQGLTNNAGTDTGIQLAGGVVRALGVGKIHWFIARTIN